MRKYFLLFLCLLQVLGVFEQCKVWAQTASVTIQYGGYTTQCCSANSTNYFCFNSPDNSNYCGQTTTCNTQSFTDPVPAGNIVTQITVNYYSAGCAGGTMSGTLNGSSLGSTPEDNNGCLCNSTAWTPHGTSTSNFPCGITNSGYSYNYGGSNNFQFCASGGQICIDRAVLNISYAPNNQSNPASQPGAITGSSSGCTGTSLSYSISSVSNATSYTWSVPAGWSINSGQGSTSITTTVGGSSGSICVTASNACGTSAPSCLSVSPSTSSTAPSSASASPSTICSGSSTLTVSGGSLGTGANWQWYSGSCGGTFVGTGPSISVSPSSATTYFVRAEGGCNTTGCVSVTVNFNTPSTDPSGAFASTNPTCGGSTTVSVSGGSLGTGANWTWYSGGCGGPSVGTGSSISVSPSSTTTYFVQAIGTCNTTSCASITVNVDQAATANAGSDGSICGSGTYSLAGAIGGSATSLTWSSSGTGSFNNTSLSNAVYTPSAGDISGGSVTLTLTTNDPSGPCPTVSDNMILTIESPATANAGSDNTICAGDPYTLSGSIGGGASSLSWSSSGTGTFDNPAISNATYTPSATDIFNGTVTLTLTTNDPPGSCTQATDNMVLTISTAPTANAGSDNSVCAGSSFVLSGSFGGSATSSIWTTSGTGSFNNASLPNAIYTPSGGDIATGSVTLTITTNDPPGSCTAVSDNILLTIDQAAVANAGSDASVCDGNTYTLSGSIGGSATALSWSTLGSGTFDNAAIPNATYTPSASDISAGTVNLIITTNDPPNSCNAISDTVVLTINQLDNATFSYSPASYCQSSPNPTPTISGLPAGTFSGVAGITVNASTGEIDLASSTIGGPYTITYTTNGACPNSSTFDVFVTNSPDATFSYSVTQHCQNGSNPSPVIIPPASPGTFSGSPAGLTFVSTSTGVIDVAASTPGIYVVTNDIPAASGCPATSANTTVQIIAADDATFSYSSASYCKSATNPVANVSGVPGGTFSEGSGNVSINPSTGEIDLTASTIGGPYTITYTTNGTCTNTSTVQVSIVSDNDPTFTYSASAYCQSEPNPTPAISGTPGGTFSSPAGLIFVSSSSGQVNLSASTTGTYDITYNTGGACADSSIFQVTINPDANATITAAGPFCESDALVNLNAAQGGGTWSGTGITDGVNGTFDPFVATVGTHTITYSISTVCGDTATADIIVNPDKDATIIPLAGTLCTNDAPVPLTTVQSGGTWSGSPAIIGNAFNPAISGAGTFTITYTMADPCGDVDTETITVNQSPDATINTIPPLCTGDAPYPLSGVQGGGTWSSPSSALVGTAFNPAISGAGTFTVTYTISGTCSNSGTDTITVNQSADATITLAVDSLCTGDAPLPLTSVQGGGIWSGSPAIIGNAFNPAISGAGTFTVTYTISGTCGDVDTETITVNQSPTITSVGPYCAVEPPVNLTANPSGGTWSGIGITNASTGAFDPSVVNGSTAITYTSTGNCSTTVTIVINPKLNASITSDSILCSTYPMDTLTAVNSTSSDIWQIINSSGNIIASLNPALPTYNPASLQPGNYTINHIIQGICGDTETVNLTIIYTPDATILGPSSFCSNSDTVLLSAVDTSSCCDSWTGIGIVDIDLGGYYPGAAGINPPNYDTVTHYITDPTGKCSTVDTIAIFVNQIPPPVLTFPDIACIDDVFTLMASDTSVLGTGVLNWYYDSLGTMLAASDTTSFIPVVSDSVADSVYVFYVQEENGNCPSGFTPVTLTVINSAAEFTTNPTDSGEIPMQVVFSNTSFISDTVFNNFLWTFGDDDSSTLFAPLHTYDEIGDYTITLTVTDDYGVCQSVFTYKIHAKGTSVVEVPNIFTPNGDGKNEVFNVIYKNLKEAEGIIYNRWGELIFKWSSVDAGWDGRTLSGTLAPDGVYYYLITATGTDEPEEKHYEFKGAVTLMR